MDQEKQHQLLYEFLEEVGLPQHFHILVNELKVHSIAQLKYVHKEDLAGVGISKSDAQRLLKQSQKSRHSALSKFKKKLTKTADGDDSTAPSPAAAGKSLVRSRPISVSMREGSGRAGLHAGMISAPQNDFRHTLHVGYDGTVFGDASFLGPSQMISGRAGITRLMNDDMCASSMSLPTCDRYQTLLGSQSNVSLVSGSSVSCMASIISSDTLTDVSSLQDLDEEKMRQLIIDEDQDDLGDLTIPDFPSLDLGPSLMDEVFQALGGSNRATAPNEFTCKRNASNNIPSCMSTSVGQILDSKVREDVPPLVELNHSAFVESRGSLSNIANDQETNKKDETALRIGAASMAESTENMLLVHPETRLNCSPKITKKKVGKTGMRSDCRSVSPSIIRVPRSSELPEKSRSSRCESSRNAIDGVGVSEDSWNTTRVRRDPAKRAHSKGERTAHRSLDNQLQVQKDTLPVSSFSSSSDFLLSGARSTSQFTSSSSGSLPGKSGLEELCAKPLRPSSFIGSSKVLHEAVPVDCETNPIRSFGKAAFSRFTTGLRSTMSSSRVLKEDLPPTNLNINTHFFDRLREQELENAARLGGNSDDDNVEESDDMVKLSDSIQSDESISKCRLVVSTRSDGSGISSITGVSPYDSSSRTSRLGVGENDDDSSFMLPYDSGSQCDVLKNSEVTALSNRSVESQHSSSHESVTSNVTQPSDEGVYSDDSVAATSDHDQAMPDPKSSRQRPVSRLNSVAMSLTASQLGFGNDRDVFWTRKVNFVRRVNSKTGSVKQATSSPTSNQELEDIQAISSIVSDVAPEDCLYALTETGWDVNLAVKLLLLRRLIGSSGASSDCCKQALLMTDWDLEQASSYLVAHSTDKDSPEIVHV